MSWSQQLSNPSDFGISAPPCAMTSFDAVKDGQDQEVNNAEYVPQYNSTNAAFASYSADMSKQPLSSLYESPLLQPPQFMPLPSGVEYAPCQPILSQPQYIHPAGHEWIMTPDIHTPHHYLPQYQQVPLDQNQSYHCGYFDQLPTPIDQYYAPSSQFYTQSGTISPSLLGPHHDNQPITNDFTNINQSRGSSSSSSSNEGVNCATWFAPEEQALGLDLGIRQTLGYNNDSATINETPSIPAPAPAPRRRPLSLGNGFNFSAMQITRPLILTPPATGIAEAMRQYVNAAKRSSFGERKIMVMSPKVGQKSYNTERRYLCPPPQAILIGTSWWSNAHDGPSDSRILPPRVGISLTGESQNDESKVNWSTIAGQAIGDTVMMRSTDGSDVPCLGTVVGGEHHISPKNRGNKDIKALVTVKAPMKVWAGSDSQHDQMNNDGIIGTFESKEIRIISKPNPKKTAKVDDLTIHHGSTIALFNRPNAQRTSTRYLNVNPDLPRIYGSGGRSNTSAMPSAGMGSSSVFAGFELNTSVWESFIIWLVDLTKSGGPGSGKPLHPDWPIAPANAIPADANAPLLEYNKHVVLQSLQTGLCTPTLIVRRVECEKEKEQEKAKAKAREEETKRAQAAIGVDYSNKQSGRAVAGKDLIWQLQKVAFEIYRPGANPSSALYPAKSYWLSTTDDPKSSEVDSRLYTPPFASSASKTVAKAPTPATRWTNLPMTPCHSGSALIDSPLSPMSSASSDYFGHTSRKSSTSTLWSPLSLDISLPTANSTGPERRPRNGSIGRANVDPLSRPSAGHRKRSSIGEVSPTNPYEQLSVVAILDQVNGGIKGACEVNLKETTWNIIGVEQISHNFYIPPFVENLSESDPYLTTTKDLTPVRSADVGSHMTYQYTSTPDIPLAAM